MLTFLLWLMLKIIYTCKMSHYGEILIMYISAVSMKLPESMKCPNSGRPLIVFFSLLAPSWLINLSEEMRRRSVCGAADWSHNIVCGGDNHVEHESCFGIKRSLLEKRVIVLELPEIHICRHPKFIVTVSFMDTSCFFMSCAKVFTVKVQYI